MKASVAFRGGQPVAAGTTHIIYHCRPGSLKDVLIRLLLAEPSPPVGNIPAHDGPHLPVEVDHPLKGEM